MKALVTGASGFLGSHIVGALASAGHDIRVLHRANSNLLALREQLGDAPHLAIQGDILDEAALARACEGCDWLFHCAAIADYWRNDNERLITVNIEGTRRVLTAALNAGIQRVIFTSSASSIGPGLDGQIANECEPFRLEARAFPYAWSKQQAEQLCTSFMERGLELVILNPTVLVGPGDLNLLAGSYLRLVKKLGAFCPILRGGAMFADVRDVALQHLAAAERGQPGERYLLGSENWCYEDLFVTIARILKVPRPRYTLPNSILEILATGLMGLRAIGFPIRVHPQHARLLGQRYFYDCQKAHLAFGPPRISIEQSLSDAYSWYERHGFVENW